MNKNKYEKLNDWFLNFFRQLIFIRCYEKIVIIISEITWYKVCPNVDKKPGIILKS